MCSRSPQNYVRGGDSEYLQDKLSWPTAFFDFEVDNCWRGVELISKKRHKNTRILLFYAELIIKGRACSQVITSAERRLENCFFCNGCRGGFIMSRKGDSVGFGKKKWAGAKPGFTRYRVRDAFLSADEIAFFRVLQSAVADMFAVFPKVNLNRIFIQKSSRKRHLPVHWLKWK